MVLRQGGRKAPTAPPVGTVKPVPPPAPPVPKRWRVVAALLLGLVATPAAAADVWVSPQSPAATDAGNDGRSYRRPRLTIPNPIPAGSRVLLVGRYDTPHEGRSRVRALGTDAEPVTITSGSRVRAVVSQTFEITGNHATISRLVFAGVGYVTIQAPTHDITIDDIDQSGSLTTGGVAIVSYGAGVNDHVTIRRSYIHDNGNLQDTGDQDRHGIVVREPARDIRIEENELARNSGDGLQINAGSDANRGQIERVWVARNVAHHNKQAGLWTKQATDVVFIGNTVFGHRPSSSSGGVCLGSQYNPEHVWFIANEAFECDYGIQIASQSATPGGVYQFIIGNRIHDVFATPGAEQPGSAWQPCGISVPGGQVRYIIGNTIARAGSGLCAPASGGAVYVYDNAVGAVTGSHLFAESATVTGARNAFAGLLSVRGIAPLPATMNPPTLGTGDGDRPARDSALVGAGSAVGADLAAYFLARYGVSIAGDFYEAPRPTPPSVGAVEP